MVLQVAIVPSGRKIIDSPEGYGQLARLRCWSAGPVDLATVTRTPPCTRPNWPITWRTHTGNLASRVGHLGHWHNGLKRKTRRK